MFKRILLAYDGSDGGDAALAKAAELAKICDAELTILTAYRHRAMLEASLSMVRGNLKPGGNLDDAMRSAARDAADHAKAWAREAGVAKVSAFIKAGPPARTIIAFAEEHACDLIVIGSRGLGGTEGYLLGSVSHKVTSLSGRPVLVV